MSKEHLSPLAINEIAVIAATLHDEYVQRDHDYFLFTDGEDNCVKIARARRGTDHWQDAMSNWIDGRVLNGENDEPAWYEHLTGRRQGWTFTTFRMEITQRVEETLVSLAVHDYNRLVRQAVDETLARAATGDRCTSRNEPARQAK